MKFYKNDKNEVFAYEDNFNNIDKNLISITEQEALDLTNPPLTAEELASQAERDHKINGEDYDLNGTLYKVSFMKNDGDAVMQVNAGFQMGLTETKIHFSNGTIMPIKATEFQAFATWFVNKRNSFFI